MLILFTENRKLYLMTERQTPAIVLTVREYGEADLLVNFLTPEHGPLTGIAKHARKSCWCKSRCCSGATGCCRRRST